MAFSRFSFPTAIQFGPGVRARLPAHLHERGFKRPLLVTDQGLAALPLFAQLQSDLKAAGLDAGAFGGVWGNPVKSQVAAGVAAFHAHNADCLVGVGGGAALDVAKAIVLMVNHPGDLFDY
jgi:alcohol dehydrogenase class IV